MKTGKTGTERSKSTFELVPERLTCSLSLNVTLLWLLASLGGFVSV